MAKKNKLIILAIVTVAVVLVLVATNRPIPSTTEKNQSNTENTGHQMDTGETEDLKFNPTGDPYAAFLEARHNEMPVVLEFYARW